MGIIFTSVWIHINDLKVTVSWRGCPILILRHCRIYDTRLKPLTVRCGENLLRNTLLSVREIFTLFGKLEFRSCVSIWVFATSSV